MSHHHSGIAPLSSAPRGEDRKPCSNGCVDCPCRLLAMRGAEPRHAHVAVRELGGTVPAADIETPRGPRDPATGN